MKIQENHLNLGAKIQIKWFIRFRKIHFFDKMLTFCIVCWEKILFILQNWFLNKNCGFATVCYFKATFLCLGQHPYQLWLLCIFKYSFKTSLLSNLHRVSNSSRLYHNGLMWKWENHHEIIIFLGMLSTLGGCCSEKHKKAKIRWNC